MDKPMRRFEADNRYMRRMILTYVPFAARAHYLEAVSACEKNNRMLGELNALDRFSDALKDGDDHALGDMIQQRRSEIKDYLDPKEET